MRQNHFGAPLLILNNLHTYRITLGTHDLIMTTTHTSSTSDIIPCLHTFPLHMLQQEDEAIAVPSRFNNPFFYTPHPLCLRAAALTMEHIANLSALHRTFSAGKMLGVLVVKTQEERLGYLAAYSGLTPEAVSTSFFVPPIYDLSATHDFYIREDAAITYINREISDIERDPDFLRHTRMLAEKERAMQEKLTLMQEEYQRSKKERDLQRSALRPDQIEEIKALEKESQFMKAEIRRCKMHLQEEMQPLREAIAQYSLRISELKNRRKQLSASLQNKIFSHFTFLNARGESRDLLQIFSLSPIGTPPGGAGECAGPRLLQYAYRHHLYPIAMAEFWYGHPSGTVPRKHGHFYPACLDKCAPILSFMTEGLDMVNLCHASMDDDSNAFKATTSPHEGEHPHQVPYERAQPYPLHILHEDEQIMVVTKPAGMLSVPGRDPSIVSLYDILRQLRPEATGPLLVHRLDMDTSGLLLIAKDPESHARLARMFASREVEKSYLAITTRRPSSRQGVISLPLCPHPTYRPLQSIDYSWGKPSISRYEIIGETTEGTLLSLRPLTGRTHQLRAHSSHPLGLDAPIVGDRLYGTPSAQGLRLHAERLSFRHPKTGEKLSFHLAANWEIETK